MLSIYNKVFFVLCFDFGLLFVNCCLEITDVDKCLCPGNNLTLKCSSTIGNNTAGLIIWKGSAFNCTNEGNEIALLRTHAGKTYTCNSDTLIVGWSFLVNSSSSETFVSMLSVPINSALIGKNIACYQSDGEQEHIIGSYTISAPTVSIITNLLKFNWSITANNHSECPPNASIYILSSRCGICPNTTNVADNTGGCMFTVKLDCKSQFQRTVTVNAPPSASNGNSVSTILPILTGVIILLLFVGLISLFAIIVRLMLSCRKIKATDQIQAQNRSQFMETDCNLYDAIDEDHQTDNNIIKTVDNKNMGIYCGGLEGCQYEEYIPTFGEGILNLENILVHLRGRVTFKWYKFGIALGVPSKVLEQLEGSLDEDALTKVLQYWLENHSSEPTWKEVSSALQDIIS